jgi:hypothetical protein
MHSVSYSSFFKNNFSVSIEMNFSTRFFQLQGSVACGERKSHMGNFHWRLTCGQYEDFFEVTGLSKIALAIFFFSTSTSINSTESKLFLFFGSIEV